VTSSRTERNAAVVPSLLQLIVTERLPISGVPLASTRST